jgi:nucleotide-binding universal stress UspA family protein
MKNILVPCDFSKPAISAFKFALDIAEQANGSIHLLHVVELPVIHDTVKSLVLPYEQDFKLKVKEITLDELSKLIKKYNHANVTVVADVVNHADSLVWTYKLNQKVAKPGSIKIDYKEEVEELV